MKAEQEDAKRGGVFLRAPSAETERPAPRNPSAVHVVSPSLPASPPWGPQRAADIPESPMETTCPPVTALRLSKT